MVRTISKVEEIFEDEWYLVRYSGETPEIAFNAALYYLARSQQGPRMTLVENQIELLRNAAVDRYIEIIIRDLIHENHKTSVYRGLSRSIINYYRFCAFCQRQQLNPAAVRNKAGQALQLFLERELEETANDKRSSIIDCSFGELKKYADDLGVGLRGRLADIATKCTVVGKE